MTTIEDRLASAPTFQSCICAEQAECQHDTDLAASCVWDRMRAILNSDPNISRSAAVTSASEAVSPEFWRGGAAKNFLRFEAHKAYTLYTR